MKDPETTWMTVAWAGVHSRPRIKRSLKFAGCGLHTRKEVLESERTAMKLNPNSMVSGDYLTVRFDWQRVEVLRRLNNRKDRDQVYEQLVCEQAIEQGRL